MAEEARREGAPGGEAAADGGPDLDQLNAVQRAVLAAAHAEQRPDTAPTSSNAAPSLPAGLPVQAPAPDSDAHARQASATFVHANVPALDIPPLAVHPQAQVMPKGKIRRFNGKRRKLRVGPVGFTESEHAELLAAAERHGYEGTLSGYLADIALAFIRGGFTVDLPLHTDRQEVQEFRAKIRYEVNRIGVNINQMVYVLHRDDRIEPDIRERLSAWTALLTHIARGPAPPHRRHRQRTPTDATDDEDVRA